MKFRNFTIAFLFSHHNVPFSYAKSLKRNKSNLEFPNSGNLLPVKQLTIFKKGLLILIKILNSKDARIEKVFDESFILNVSGLLLHVKSVENIATIREVFIENIYDLQIPRDGAVFVDIGLNVGYASLFFSSNKHIAKIFSFEPFPSTFEEAVRNIELNPRQKEKITCINKGISDYNGEIEVPSMESGSAMASTNRFFIENSLGNTDSMSKIKVGIDNITDVIRTICNTHPSSDLYIKLDCEGEEYKIIEAVDAAGLFGSIRGMMIEWHISGPDPITQALLKNNFQILHLPRHTDIGLDELKTGMIYAFKSN